MAIRGTFVLDSLQSMGPLAISLVCTLFTWGITALGAAVVLFFKKVRPLFLNLMLGFGAGVMIAASFWSLLAPAIEICAGMGEVPWLTPCLGLLLGGAFILLADRILDVIGPTEGARFGADRKRNTLLLIAVTLHNIPEGMVIGVAFASAALTLSGTSFYGGLVLAIGIGLQNFPEGAAVSLPLRRDGMSRARSFFYGQLSGAVEPLGAMAGVLAVSVMRGMVPFLMAFSAGAMIAVVIGELIPESVRGSKTVTIIGFILGFILMMILDVALTG